MSGHTQHAVDPMYLFGILIPAYNERGAGVFVGVVAVSLALVAIAVSWRKHLVKFFWRHRTGRIGFHSP